MHRIISADQLRTLLNDTRHVMSQEQWSQATDDQAHLVAIPHGKMEALGRLELNEWIFIPIARTQKKGGKMIEHGFEVHCREKGWQVVTAALEIEDGKTAKVHAEAARNHLVQQELEKLRLRASP